MLNRRDMMKISAFIGANLAVPTGLTLLTGCPKVNEDQIIAGLKVAQQVAINVQPIISPVNPEVGNIAGQIAGSISVILKTYNDYEAGVGDKQGNLVLLQATASAISANLVSILDGVHVKNPELITYVSVAVTVINSAITVLISSLPAQQATSARSATIQSHEALPLLRNARKASDLKAAWNNVVKMEHPEAVVK